MAKEYIDRERMIRCFCAHCISEGTEDCIDCYDKRLMQNFPAADVRENVIRTQADKLRAMSDEELAEWLNIMQSNAWHRGIFNAEIKHFPSTNAAWLDWLKQEVEDAEKT